MAVHISFDFWPRHCIPSLVPIQVLDKIGTDVPNDVRVRVDGCEDVKQVPNVHVIRRNPPCFFKLGLLGINHDRQPAEVVILGCAEEGRQFRISGTKVVSGWCQHGDEVAASRCQREKTKLVGYVLPVGMVGNNQSRSFSSIPRGKKAAIPRRSQAFGPSLGKVGEETVRWSPLGSRCNPSEELVHDVSPMPSPIDRSSICC